jgi:hypothetical protein
MSELSAAVFAPAARQSQVDQSGCGEPLRAKVRRPDAAAARCAAVWLPAVLDAECPSAGVDCRRTEVRARTWVVEQARHARLCEAPPTVESDFRRWVGSVAALPNAATPPDAAEVAARTVIRHVGRAPEPGPVQPDRRNSAHSNCRPMNGRATAAPSGPLMPATLKA